MLIEFVKNYRLYRIGEKVETSEGVGQSLIDNGTAKPAGQPEVRTATAKKPARVRKATVNPQVAEE